MASITCNSIFVLGCKYNINESNDNGKFEKKWKSEFTSSSPKIQEISKKIMLVRCYRHDFCMFKNWIFFFCFWDSSVLFTDYSPKTALWLSVSAFFVSYSLISKDFNCQLSIVNMLVLCWPYVDLMLVLCWPYVGLYSIAHFYN